MDEEKQKTFKEGPFSKLPFGGGELVRTADKIIKVYQLYVIRLCSADPSHHM